MAWRFRGDPRWGRADVLAFGAGIVAIVIFSGLFFFTGKGFESHYGLAQRFALVAAIAWLGALALALLDLYGRRRCLGSVRKTTSQIGEETP
jgi:hypothetical protein